jgi:hypothetical protein
MISSPLSIVTAGEREASKNPQWQVEVDAFKALAVIAIYPFLSCWDDLIGAVLDITTQDSFDDNLHAMRFLNICQATRFTVQ